MLIKCVSSGPTSIDCESRQDVLGTVFQNDQFLSLGSEHRPVVDRIEFKEHAIAASQTIIDQCSRYQIMGFTCTGSIV